MTTTDSASTQATASTPDTETASTPEHPPGATLHLGGSAWAHPSLADRLTPIENVTPYPGNPRRGDQDAITSSIRDLGLYRALITQASTGQVLAGNHTLRSLLELGATHVPVDPVHVDDTRAAALVIRDNRVSDTAEYDNRELLSLLADLEEADALTLAGWLNAEDELAMLYRRVEAEDVFTGEGTQHMLDEFRDITGENPSEYTPGYLAKVTVYFAHEEAITDFRTRLDIETTASTRTEHPNGYTLDLWRRYRGET